MSRKFAVEHLQGVLAVTPTPALPGADDLRASNTVNIEESERMIRRLIEDGVNGILTNGTLGEMATLTLEEWKAFAQAVSETVQSLKPDLPLFIGATTLNTRDTVERIDYLQSLGVRGVLLGRPFWCEMGPEAMLGFYQDIAGAFPDMSFILYDNPEAFKGFIPTPVYARLASIPNIIGAKYMSLGPKYRVDVDAVQGKMRLMPLDSDWLLAHLLAPENALACWSGAVIGGPEPSLYLRDALRRKDYDAARWISSRIAWSFETYLARQDFREFSKYNISIAKERFNEAGYIHSGPTRRPYQIAPESYIEGARESGRRWRQLRQEVINVSKNGSTH